MPPASSKPRQSSPLLVAALLRQPALGICRPPQIVPPSGLSLVARCGLVRFPSGGHRCSHAVHHGRVSLDPIAPAESTILSTPRHPPSKRSTTSESSTPSPMSSAHVGSLSLSSFPALPSTSARLVFATLSKLFLHAYVSFPAPDAECTWREEARFAAPPELTMCLRWGLARVLRVSGGNAVHGLVSWDMYVL
jgi:hypothetical protein